MTTATVLADPTAAAEGAIQETPAEARPRAGTQPAREPGRTLRTSRSRLLRLVSVVPYWGFHAATVVLAWQAGFTWAGLAFCVFMYYLRMFGITAGYHRYFSHRSYRTGRAFQFLLGLLGSVTLQKGVLWWAGHHRWHHRHSDTEHDVHSPRRGFWWSHHGWILSPDWEETPYDRLKDLARYPELVWLNRLHIPAFVGLCLAVYFTLGFHFLVWGCFVSTVLLWHGTFTINSLAHVIGKRVYATSDDSRNSMVLALITMGEGWHNNHHYYQTSARQGFRPGELDASYAILCLLEKVGIVWDVKRPAPEVVDGRLGGRDHLVARVGDPEQEARAAARAPALAAASS